MVPTRITLIEGRYLQESYYIAEILLKVALNTIKQTLICYADRQFGRYVWHFSTSIVRYYFHLSGFKYLVRGLENVAPVAYAISATRLTRHGQTTVHNIHKFL